STWRELIQTESKCPDPDRNQTQNLVAVRQQYPVSHSGNSRGRVKRVVSCKKKTNHLMVARRRQLGTGRTCDASNKENEMKCMQDMQQGMSHVDPWELPLTMQIKEPNNVFQITQDHGTMVDVLFERNLRLKVSLKLWQRNVGELLTYFLRIQDIGVFVDFLPLISKSIDEASPRFNIGCCVDLFPLIKKVLTKPYEEYLIVGLKWINSVLKNWREELKGSGNSGWTKLPVDRYLNFQVFNQQLLELWHQEPFLKSLPGPAGDLAKVSAAYMNKSLARSLSPFKFS
uniref:Katanin p80 subunit C-terminal domain-containing protein n=1 Tax=Mola mola TaxID=94237 RepID=A0A3Q3W1S7_MOLML